MVYISGFPNDVLLIESKASNLTKKVNFGLIFY